MNRTRIALGDALAELIDHRGKTPKKLGGDWTAGGHRVVSALNIKGSRVDDNDHHYISDEMYRRWMKVPLASGDVLLTSEAPTGEVAYLAEAQDWAIGQRLFGLRGKPGLLDGRYLFYALRGGDARHQLMSRATGTTVSGIRQSELVKIELDLPPIEEQRGIASTLGALDDKIESNRRKRELLRRLGRAEVEAAGGPAVQLRDVVESIARGVAPKYADDDPDAELVINQKCIRGGWVRTDLARRMLSRHVAPAKQAHPGDILVNSTGTGTLGRVGRWHGGATFVDSHVTVVRPDAALARPTVLAYAILDHEDDIAAMATGSTGQTELSAARLGELVIRLPSLDACAQLEAGLLAYEDRIASLQREESILASLRDSLLPGLLSGSLQVSEARQRPGVPA